MNIHYSLRRLYDTTERNISEIMSIEDIMGLEKNCKEAEAAIKEIRENLFAQVQKLQNIKVEKYIKVRRYDRYKGLVEITVFVEESKELEGHKRAYMEYGTHKKFNGSQKKKALEYANELQKKYNYKIIKENWK